MCYIKYLFEISLNYFCIKNKDFKDEYIYYIE